MDIRQIASFFGMEDMNHIKSESKNNVSDSDTKEKSNEKEMEENLKNLELVAVITAAISATAKIPQEAFSVRSIKRRNLQRQ